LPWLPRLLRLLVLRLLLPAPIREQAKKIMDVCARFQSPFATLPLVPLGLRKQNQTHQTKPFEDRRPRNTFEGD